MDIVKLQFIFQKRKLRNLKNKANVCIVKTRLKHKVEIWKNANNVSECIVDLYSFSINKEKSEQVVSVVLTKLVKKNIDLGSKVG